MTWVRGLESILLVGCYLQLSYVRLQRAHAHDTFLLSLLARNRVLPAHDRTYDNA